MNVKYDPESPLLENEDKNGFLELVGSAQWISNNTRPDVAYAANFLGRHREKPTRQHMYQAKRIWRYFSGTKNLGLTLGGAKTLRDLELWLHCDASYSNQPDDCRAYHLCRYFAREMAVQATGHRHTEYDRSRIREHVRCRTRYDLDPKTVDGYEYPGPEDWDGFPECSACG